MVLGGGGSPSPQAEVLVQLAFVAALLAWVWGARGSASIPQPLLWLGLAILAVPLIQLIPLPPAIWHALPGRELEVATLTLVGEQDSWRPLSISPTLTLAGFLALVPAIGTMWAVSTLGARDRRFVILVVALVALAGAALGALQMAGGPESFRLYEKTHRGWLTAFHANRNAAVDVLLIGSLALTARFAGSRDGAVGRRMVPLVISGQLVLLVAIVMTGSRAGIALLLVVLAFHWAIIRGNRAMLRLKWAIGALATLVTALVSLPFVLGSNPQLARVAQRFDASSDARFPLWEDTWKAIEGFGWAGSGVGSFTNAFLPFESFAYLDPASPNRAHNDYLEFLLEAGALAPVMLIAGAVILFILGRRARQLSPDDRAIQVFALGSIAIIALHSIVDYPLRNMALACLAAAAAGLLSPSPDGFKGRTRRGLET